MVAEKISRWVPASFLAGASCLLPERPAPALVRSSPAEVEILTPAEQRVLGLLVAGLSNKEIAASLDRAEPTIKHQVSSILRKSGLQSRCQLIARAARIF